MVVDSALAPQCEGNGWLALSSFWMTLWLITMRIDSYWQNREVGNISNDSACCTCDHNASHDNVASHSFLGELSDAQSTSSGVPFAEHAGHKSERASSATPPLGASPDSFGSVTKKLVGCKFRPPSHCSSPQNLKCEIKLGYHTRNLTSDNG